MLVPEISTPRCMSCHSADVEAPANCQCRIRYGHRTSRHQIQMHPLSFDPEQCCLPLLDKKAINTRKCRHLPSQQSPWIREGLRARPSDCSGRRSRGTTLSSVSLQTLNSGHRRIGFAKAITCPRCLVKTAHHESSQISTA